MKLTFATKQNLDDILQMILEAQNYFKSNGIDQWQDGYPNRKTIEEDIELNRGFVIQYQNQTVGYCVIDFAGDSNYDVVYKGSFHNKHQYAVIHRFVIKQAYQHLGLATAAFKLIEVYVKTRFYDTIRIDTHADNLKMLGLIRKLDYQYCGIIKLNRSNDERLAFDKILS